MTTESINPPKLGLQYGPDEFISTTECTFSIDDDVVWTTSDADKPLLGKIQFIGLKQTQQGNHNDTSNIFAVVLFVRSCPLINQRTCHLAGHLRNPPCNRNLVPIGELVKKGEGKWQVGPSKDNEIIELIGNCIAVANKTFETAEVQGFQAEDKISAVTNNATIIGKVVVTGTISENAGTDDTNRLRCVGVKFEKPLTSLNPTIRLKHLNADSKRCGNCAGDTLAFIPLNILSYKTTDGTSLNTNSKAIVQPEPGLINKPGKDLPQPTPPPNKEILFVGNCVADSNGFKKTPVRGVRTGDKITAQKKSKKISGIVKLTCTINASNDFNQESPFVGIQFRATFGDIYDHKDGVIYCKAKGGNQASCAKCEFGKLIFIPAKSLQTKPQFGDIRFEIEN